MRSHPLRREFASSPRRQFLVQQIVRVPKATSTYFPTSHISFSGHEESPCGLKSANRHQLRARIPSPYESYSWGFRNPFELPIGHALQSDPKTKLVPPKSGLGIELLLPVLFGHLPCNFGHETKLSTLKDSIQDNGPLLQVDKQATA